jgi:hypothetical protein
MENSLKKIDQKSLFSSFRLFPGVIIINNINIFVENQYKDNTL